MKVLHIRWLDSGFNLESNWEPVRHMMRDWKISDMEVTSVGILAYEDDDVVGLSSTFSESTDAYIGLQIIAKQNIIKRIEYDMA